MTSLGIDLDQEDEYLRSHLDWPAEEQTKERARRMKNVKSSKRNGKASLTQNLNMVEMSQEEIDAQAKAATDVATNM